MVVANEVVEEAKRRNKSCLVFKVDYEKAYDSVSWDFLSYMMKRMEFELVSRLRITFAKSKFRAIGMSHHWIQNAANYLSCKVLVIPFLYLGIPIGANSRCSVIWDPIVERCERKLSKWNQRHLSFRGRVTLTKGSPTDEFSPQRGLRQR